MPPTTFIYTPFLFSLFFFNTYNTYIYAHSHWEIPRVCRKTHHLGTFFPQPKLKSFFQGSYGFLFFLFSPHRYPQCNLRLRAKIDPLFFPWRALILAGDPSSLGNSCAFHDMCTLWAARERCEKIQSIQPSGIRLKGRSSVRRQVPQPLGRGGDEEKAWRKNSVDQRDLIGMLVLMFWLGKWRMTSYRVSTYLVNS